MGVDDAADDAESRENKLAEAITRWCRERRSEDELSRDEFANLRGVERLLKIQQGSLDAMIHDCRAHPRASIYWPVYWIIARFSDNDQGACTLSADRIARFLDRDVSSVRKAIARLRQRGLIRTLQRSGTTSLLWPAVPRHDATAMQQINVLAPPARPRGRPAENLGPLDDGVEENPGRPEDSINEETLGASEVEFSEKGRRLEAETLPSGRLPTSLLDFSREEKEGIYTREGISTAPTHDGEPIVTETHRADFHELVCDGAPDDRQPSRPQTDRTLHRIVEAHSDVPPMVVRSALTEALVVAFEANPQKASTYLSKVLRTKIGERQLMAAKQEVQFRGTVEIEGTRVETAKQRITSGGSARSSNGTAAHAVEQQDAFSRIIWPELLPHTGRYRHARRSRPWPLARLKGLKARVLASATSRSLAPLGGTSRFVRQTTLSLLF